MIAETTYQKKVKLESYSQLLTNVIASKKAITRKWGKEDPPSQDQWIGIVEEIYTMKKLTHRLRLQQTQLEEKWEIWTLFKTKTATKTTDKAN